MPIPDTRCISPTLAPTSQAVYGFLMICRAADSMPAGALVEHEEVGKYENDTWVRVEGILGLKKLESFVLPYIQADSISIIEAPKFPYLIPSFS